MLGKHKKKQKIIQVRAFFNLIPYFVIVSFVRLAEKSLCFLIHSESFSFQAFKDNLAIILLVFPTRLGVCFKMTSLEILWKSFKELDEALKKL